MKICVGCKISKELNLFSKDKSKLDGYQTYCKACVHLYHQEYYTRPEVKIRHNKRTNKFYHEHKDRYRQYARKSELKSLYGLTTKVYNEMRIKQEYKCLICDSHETTLKYQLCVDHCHQTNQIRGLLCKSCNLMIGNAKDSFRILEKAAEYLKNKAPF